MGDTESVVNVGRVMYALADTIAVWSPVLIFLLCCSIIALIGYLFDAWHE